MIPNKEKELAVQRIIIVEGLANLIVLLGKLWVGLVTGSLAVLGDAVHSFSDVVNNVIAWVVTRLSNQPPDREHPYGHYKFETLAVFFLASLLVVMSFELLLSAVRRGDDPVSSSSFELLVMLVVLLINVSLAVWQRWWAKRLRSDILLADSSHTFADVMTTVVVLVGWQLSAMGYVWVDRLCAVGVALVILYLAYDLFKSVMPALTDEYSLEPDAVSKVVLEVSGVKGVQKVRSRWIGSYKAVDLVLLVESSLSTEESHNIATAVENRLEAEFEAVDISIHVEPYSDKSV